MTFALDVVFLDGKGRVLDLVRSLRPWRWPKRVSAAAYVLEVPVGTIEMSGTQIGDELTWREPSPYSISILSEDRGADGASAGLRSEHPSPTETEATGG
jgi:hypothetical protein